MLGHVDLAAASDEITSNIAFKGVGDYLPVDAGTYDLEVRVAGTETVALAVPGVQLDNGIVYTVFAMGLASGEPALTAVPSADNLMASTLPTTGGLPVSSILSLIALALGALLLAGGLLLRARLVRSR